MDFSAPQNLVTISDPIEMPVSELLTGNYHFSIPSYQRGYRWTEAEVKALLDDIHEFSQSNYQGSNTNSENRFYCLQPIIVTKNEEDSNWKIIDGQQRMTTLYLIFL